MSGMQYPWYADKCLKHPTLWEWKALIWSACQYCGVNTPTRAHFKLPSTDEKKIENSILLYSIFTTQMQ